MAQTKNFPPFQAFIQSLQVAKTEQFIALPQAKVAEEKNFEKMRAHIIKHYEGVSVDHSFMDETGQVWDCIPVDQQPSLRKSGQKAAMPPDLPPAVTEAGEGNKPNETKPLLSPETKDEFGNAMFCPPGTIPIRRLTLEEMTRFETLEDFFQKGPVGKGRHPRINSAHALTVAATHKYAHAYQIINNLGGHSFISVEQPAIGSNQIFSLSQQWYAGGSGVGLQTAEVGWQVYPQKYGTPKPCLFIYWTADGYNKTGCYNHDCGAFVQTNPNWTLGGYLNPISVIGGAQYDLEVAYYLYQGNWWLYLKGAAIGYYPTAIYNHGQLATCATDIDYGGEVVGTTSWPPMGSGVFANQGWTKAAYQRNIYYYPTTGGAAWASLNASQPSPACFTINVAYASNWGEYFFFGGPGGTGC